MRLWTLVLCVLASFQTFERSAHAESKAPTRVVVITLDGVRQQEFFNGVDPNLGKNLKRDASEEILPFVWKDLVRKKHAWVFGNRNHGAICRTDNPMTVSLPAYADLLSGVRQSRVEGNGFTGDLEFPTVPDRLMAAGFTTSDIAVMSSWENIRRVVSQNHQPSFFVEGGRQQGDVQPPWWHARYDAATMGSVEKKLKQPDFQPSFMMISFNDSDEWAHKGEYPNYVEAIRKQDQYIRRIYDLVESKPGYGGNTIYVIATDHSRGDGASWTDHGYVANSEFIWAVVYAPQLEHKPTSLLMNCSHSAIGQWIYEKLTNREFQTGLTKSQ